MHGFFSPCFTFVFIVLGFFPLLITGVIHDLLLIVLVCLSCCKEYYRLGGL